MTKHAQTRPRTPSTLRRAAASLVGAVAVAVAVVAAGGAAATPAVAEDGPSITASSRIGSNSGGANVRTGPNTNSSSLGYLLNDTPVTMQCWVDAQLVFPPLSDYPSTRWFKSSTPAGTGYIHSSLVEDQTSVGRC
ncbi:SH3 domain-containing protein [Actinosynnema pretiosum subsp. pretiosum]|uniref:SH3 domain-containing protein n=1 Tax=Actinosynnema pretiosum subsp. pretiosum TaxID=103721 RepID=A0AA45L7Y4_9PSEU|nr:hypothetical protein APASM_3846 [Actinosynnema pretiosum subsp. pretiosum]QUF04718.1 SH3 domain-containing protein [Actinosynnema pretiosum subsp. pretiosum]